MREGDINMKFIRRNWSKFSRLGKTRKNKQTWRRPNGRHSKTRNKRKGYPAKVTIGYKTEKKERGLIENKKPVLVSNLKDLEKIKQGEIAIVSKIGNKKRIEIAKKAKEKGIPIHNVNINKILKRYEKMKMKKTNETKSHSEEKKGSVSKEKK